MRSISFCGIHGNKGMFRLSSLVHFSCVFISECRKSTLISATGEDLKELTAEQIEEL